MNERDSLLSAVRSQPDDDLPRLVFADWLEESGHPAEAARAAFIRTQIDLAALPADSPEIAPLRERVLELRTHFQDEWDQLFAEEPPNLVEVIRRRGFVDEIHGPIDQLIRHGPRMFNIAPIRTIVVQPSLLTALRTFSSRLAEPFGLSSLTRIGSQFLGIDWLELFGNDYDRMIEFVRDGCWSSLRCLRAPGCYLDDEFVVRFVSLFPHGSFAPGLQELDLSDNPITDAGANTLAAARGFDGLKRLRLANTRITDAGAERLHRRYGSVVEL